MKLKHTILIFSLLALVVGFSDLKPALISNLGVPVGAVLFGLFLIAQVFEKELALYDGQNRAPEPLSFPPHMQSGQISVQEEVAHHPDLTMANPH